MQEQATMVFGTFRKRIKKEEADNRGIIDIYESGSPNFTKKFELLTLEEQIAAVALILEAEPSQKELNKWLTDNYGQLITSVWREKMTEGYSLEKATKILKKRDKLQLKQNQMYPGKIIEAITDNEARKTQEDWVGYFNSRGEVMVSMPDLYHAGKSKDENLLAALKKDFKDTWEVTSTRLIFQPDNLNAKVVHYFGSTVIEPIEIEVVIPDYSYGGWAKDVLDNSDGLAFFQAICGTNDDKEVILETLVNLSGKKGNKLRVWTPDQESRKGIPIRQLVCGDSLGINGIIFHIDCIYKYGGRSYQVQK